MEKRFDPLTRQNSVGILPIVILIEQISLVDGVGDGSIYNRGESSRYKNDRRPTPVGTAVEFKTQTDVFLFAFLDGRGDQTNMSSDDGRKQITNGWNVTIGVAT